MWIETLRKGDVTIFGLDSSDSDEAQAQYLDNGHHGPNCGGADCNSHSFNVEHAYYKQAIAEKWPGWENAKWIPMDSVPVVNKEETSSTTDVSSSAEVPTGGDSVPVVKKEKGVPAVKKSRKTDVSSSARVRTRGDKD